MLKHFKYLDEGQLDHYIAQVEDGLRQSSTRTAGRSGKQGAGFDAKVVKGDVGRTSEASFTEHIADTGPAKFERLLTLVRGHEEQFGWVEVLQEVDLESARAGSLIDVSADLYSPDITKMAGAGGFLEMLPLARAIAKMSNSDSLAGLPSADQLDTMEAFMKAMPKDILQGEVLDSDWSLIGQLPLGAPRDLEGEARVVGKVARVWGPGSWRPLPGLPIISQMPRDQRREFERKGPQNESQEMMWVEGPAMELDILAIYR